MDGWTVEGRRARTWPLWAWCASSAGRAMALADKWHAFADDATQPRVVRATCREAGREWDRFSGQEHQRARDAWNAAPRQWFVGIVADNQGVAEVQARWGRSWEDPGALVIIGRGEDQDRAREDLAAVLVGARYLPPEASRAVIPLAAPFVWRVR